jgi:LacI family transcriptional regulator
MRAAHALGRAVPDEVAVMGFDDGELAEALDPTTVRQPLEGSGRTAMEMLFQRLDGVGTTCEIALGLSPCSTSHRGIRGPVRSFSLCE